MLLLFAVLAPAFVQARDGRADALAILSDLRLAVAQAEDKVTLTDILENRAKVGFDPVLRRGRTVAADPGETIWLRVRADVPAGSGQLYLSLPRQAIDSMTLYSSASLDKPLAMTGISHQATDERWPDAFVLPLPPGDNSGTTTAYVAIKGRGLLNLQADLLDDARVRDRAASASDFYSFLYASLFLVAALATVRRWTKGEPGYRLAQAGFAVLAASMVDAYHLQLSIGGAPLTSRPNLPVALWLLACAALLRATQQFAGHEKNSPGGAQLVERGAWAVAALGLLALFVPAFLMAHSQVLGFVVLLLTAIVCCVSLVMDPRHWRWTMLLAWLGVLVALLALPLAWAQAMPETLLARRGFQLLMALLLACYLVLPWVRQTLRARATARRAIVPQESIEEKISSAREYLMNSLQAGMESADKADMEWIAYRRLMTGLKPVLPQSASAVIAMGYHDEDLLMVEPPSAEPRFRMLVSQRASLLKSLSRSLGPQQIVIDFDGPEGPLAHVMLAIIPLPVDRPGWGALVIERAQEDTYSEAELDLCTEFAALATTAADEAAEAMEQRHVKEIDSETGAYRATMQEAQMARAMELSLQKRKPVGVLRVVIDNLDKLAPETLPSLVRDIADTMREEIDFGEAIVRRGPGDFLVFLAGRNAGEVRALGERICTEMRRHPLPGADGPLTVSVGVGQMLPGEKSALPCLERAERALEKAQSYGGNQAQMILSTKT